LVDEVLKRLSRLDFFQYLDDGIVILDHFQKSALGYLFLVKIIGLYAFLAHAGELSSDIYVPVSIQEIKQFLMYYLSFLDLDVKFWKIQAQVSKDRIVKPVNGGSEEAFFFRNANSITRIETAELLGNMIVIRKDQGSSS